MQYTTLLALAAAAAPAFAAPTPTEVLAPRVQQCGQWDSVQTGTYTLYADLWNENAGTGSQCSEVTSLSGSNLAWDTTWSWSGGSNQVKSFSNVVLKSTIKQLKSFSNIPTTWNWSYSGSNIVADVAYDLFTSSSATGSNEYEVMIWLAAIGGAGPISSTGSPIATVTLSGVSFNLYYGLNGSMKVYSFVAANKYQTTFSGNLMDFFNYLIKSQDMPNTQYLLSIGAGTEPFTGSNAKLTVSKYSVTAS